MFKKYLSVTIIVCFFLTTLGPLPKAHADTVLGLPVPGTMVNLSPAYMPVLIKGARVHPDNPLLFDFILDTGKSGLKIDSPEFKAESQKLIKYFLAALTIKEDDLWVNLSPYEKDRMIPQELGKTEMGRDMLAQDYILKQLTASLIYPERELGKKFWDNVYSKARQMYGVTNIPVNTFNKVWIVADKAKVLERNNTAYVVGAHLKVMLEEDYLALQNHSTASLAAVNDTHAIGANVVREIIVPALEKEVNQGQNFATLRQMFYSMILATWYKSALKDALLNQVYSNKAKTSGVLSDDPAVKEKIYQQYLQAYKKGVFNYIKEDVDTVNQQPMPRKYFSGGLRLGIDHAMAVEHKPSPDDMIAGTAFVFMPVMVLPFLAVRELANGMTEGLDGYNRLSRYVREQRKPMLPTGFLDMGLAKAKNIISKAAEKLNNRDLEGQGVRELQRGFQAYVSRQADSPQLTQFVNDVLVDLFKKYHAAAKSPYIQKKYSIIITLLAADLIRGIYKSPNGGILVDFRENRSSVVGQRKDWLKAAGDLIPKIIQDARMAEKPAWVGTLDDVRKAISRVTWGSEFHSNVWVVYEHLLIYGAKASGFSVAEANRELDSKIGPDGKKHRYQCREQAGALDIRKLPDAAMLTNVFERRKIYDKILGYIRASDSMESVSLGRDVTVSAAILWRQEKAIQPTDISYYLAYQKIREMADQLKLNVAFIPNPDGIGGKIAVYSANSATNIRDLLGVLAVRFEEMRKADIYHGEHLIPAGGTFILEFKPDEYKGLTIYTEDGQRWVGFAVSRMGEGDLRSGVVGQPYKVGQTYEYGSSAQAYHLESRYIGNGELLFRNFNNDREVSLNEFDRDKVGMDAVLLPGESMVVALNPDSDYRSFHLGGENEQNLGSFSISTAKGKVYRGHLAEELPLGQPETYSGWKNVKVTLTPLSGGLLVFHNVGPVPAKIVDAAMAAKGYTSLDIAQRILKSDLGSYNATESDLQEYYDGEGPFPSSDISSEERSIRNRQQAARHRLAESARTVLDLGGRVSEEVLRAVGDSRQLLSKGPDKAMQAKKPDVAKAGGKTRRDIAEDNLRSDLHVYESESSRLSQLSWDMTVAGLYPETMIVTSEDRREEAYLEGRVQDARQKVAESARTVLDLGGKVSEEVLRAVGDSRQLLSKGPDRAMQAKTGRMPPGGIDLNAKNMGLDVAKDGKGINMKFDPAMVAEFQNGNFTGVEGIILRIVPIQSPLPILGLETTPVDGKPVRG